MNPARGSSSVEQGFRVHIIAARHTRATKNDMKPQRNSWYGETGVKISTETSIRDINDYA